MKGKYCLSILLVIVLLLALNPENNSVAQGEPTGAVSIEETRGFDPPLISYQGRLVENGDPVTGTRTMTFRFFYSESGGTAVWTETKSVLVTKGMFQTNLGDTTPFSFATINKMDQNLWLEVTVGSTTMPRQLMTGSPYAFSLVPGAHIHGVTEFLLQAVNEGTGTGLFGASRFGTGVFGESFGEDSNAFGIHGVSELGAGVAGWSKFGTGVLGKSIAKGSIGYGVHGVSDGGTGVAGWSETGFGVVGWSDQGSGVWGRSEDSSGVIGESTNNNGVHGISETGNAVLGESVSGNGVVGTSTGFNSAGVHGISQNGPGVVAHSSASGVDPWPALQVHSFAPTGVGVVSMTDSANANMVLEQMGTGPILVGMGGTDPDMDFIVENDGSVKQSLDANGLVKVGLHFFCGMADESGVGGVNLISSFNNVGGEITLSADNTNPGGCTIGFEFDITNRYWSATDPQGNPILVSCKQISNHELFCARWDIAHTTPEGWAVTAGYIMLILY